MEKKWGKDMENMEENRKKIWKIGKKIVKRYVKYGRKVSWNLKWYGEYGKNASRIVKKYEKYGRNPSWIVKRYGRYGRKTSFE